MKKKYPGIFIFITLLIMCGISACSQPGADKTAPSEKTQFLKNTYNNFSDSSGIYFCPTDGFLYYFDYTSQKSSLVCSKSNCLHREPTADMPEEMYCDAYTGYSPVFKTGDMLYTVTASLMGNQLYTITASNSDRTNQKSLVETEHAITSFYVYENHLYYVADEFLVEEFEDGGSGTTGATISSLYMLDLEDGSEEILITLDSAFSSAIQLTGYCEDILYLQYITYEEKITEENIDTVNSSVEYYTLSMADHTLTPIFEDLWNEYYWFICQQDNLIYFHEYDDTNSIRGNICTYNLESQELTVIIPEVFYDQYADNKIIYYEMSLGELEHTSYDQIEKTGYYYDMDTLEAVSFDYIYEYRICDEYDDYFVMLYIDSSLGNSYWHYMLKADYYKGENTYISML